MSPTVSAFIKAPLSGEKLRVDITTDLPANIFDGTANSPCLPRDQFNLRIVVEKSGDVDLPLGKIGGVLEAAGIAAVLRQVGTKPKTDAVTVAPVTPRRAQAQLQIAADFLGAGGMPNALGAHQPAMTIDEFLRLGIEPAPRVKTRSWRSHDRAQMMIREIGEKDFAMADKAHGKSQGH